MRPKKFIEHKPFTHRKISTSAEAARFIRSAGFCMLFPIKNFPLISLYEAIKDGQPPRKFNWDRDVENLWKWKDLLGEQRRAYYGKYFRGRGTFISLELLPHFLAMREIAAAPEDFQQFHAAGKISNEACAIWEALSKHGPMATLELRHACKLDSKRGNVRFKRAMVELQCLLVVVHSGVEQETAAWASGRFELTSRAFPGAARAASGISPQAARSAIAAKYLEWHPGAETPRVARLFGWSKQEAMEACPA
ncbi:MAG: AlkZ-related protein [Candidatus Acidiferrales bacterium]